MPLKKKCWCEGFQQFWQKSCRILSWLSQSLKASLHATFAMFLFSFSNWFHSFSVLAWLWWYIIDIDHHRSVLGDACIFTSQISNKYSDDDEWMMSKAGTVQGKWGSASPPFELLLLAHHSYLTDLAFRTLALVFRTFPICARQLK